MGAARGWPRRLASLMTIPRRVRAGLALVLTLLVIYVWSRGYVRRMGDDPPAPDTPAADSLEHIHVPGVARLPVFTPAVAAGDLVFLSGAIGTPASGELRVVEGGVQSETHATMANIRRVLEAAGLDMEDLVKCTVFLADMDDYQAMNEAYASYFQDIPPPARSAVAGSGLALGARVEIDCIARRANGM